MSTGFRNSEVPVQVYKRAAHAGHIPCYASNPPFCPALLGAWFPLGGGWAGAGQTAQGNRCQGISSTFFTPHIQVIKRMLSIHLKPLAPTATANTAQHYSSPDSQETYSARLLPLFPFPIHSTQITRHVKGQEKTQSEETKHASKLGSNTAQVLEF